MLDFCSVTFMLKDWQYPGIASSKSTFRRLRRSLAPTPKPRMEVVVIIRGSVLWRDRLEALNGSVGRCSQFPRFSSLITGVY